MRARRVSSPPCRNGKGFFVLAILVIAALAGPARADHANVSVTLRVSAGQPVATHTTHLCTVTVRHDADAVAVLEGARGSGCIDSYETQPFSGLGRKVTCIDGVCETAVTYWRFTVNGAFSDVGVDQYEARQGHEVGFSYTAWVTCFTPLGC